MSMKLTTLRQNSLAWLDAKQKRVGASEAYALIRHYATDEELLAAGLQPEDVRGDGPCAGELPYTSAYGIYNRIVNGVEIPSISIWDDLFGKAVETWVKSKFKVPPHDSVYMSATRVCSLDAVDGIGAQIEDVVIPDGAPIEIKSRRASKAGNEPKLAWIVQNTLQQDACGQNCGYILQVVLEDNSENMRGAVAKMYENMPRKKFFAWFDGLPKTVTLFPNPLNDRLLALYNVCEARFFEDVRTKTAPVPVIPEELNKRAVQELLGSYDAEYVTPRPLLFGYMQAKQRLENATKDVNCFLQMIFEECVAQHANRLRDEDGNTGKWSKAGSLLVKPPKENATKD